MSYDLTGKGTTLLKVGTGLMFDRLWENPITPTYYNNKYVDSRSRRPGTSGSLARRVSKYDSGRHLPATHRWASATSTSCQTR